MSIGSIMGAQEKLAHVPGKRIPRSLFDLSHPYKATGDAGKLYPVLALETLPGDTFSGTTAIVARVQTLLHPLMDNIFATIHYFHVPRRLVWENWERFMGFRPQVTDSIDFLIPELDLDGYGEIQHDDLFAYLYGCGGVDFKDASRKPDACYARAYNLIWNEWYRAEQLQDSLNVPLDDGPDDPSDYQIRRRGKRHDYFTSALPSPQMGPSVPIAMSPNIPVTGDGNALGLTLDGTDVFAMSRTNTAYDGERYTLSASAYLAGDPVATSRATGGIVGSPSIEYAVGVTEDPTMSGLHFDATLIGTINTLREHVTLQQFFETENIFGNRYTESVYGHFGVHTGDFRVQRPEYIGGGETRIVVSTVPQSSASETGSPQGNLAAFGVAGTASGGRFTYTAVEHGMIIGLLSFRADITYQQNLHRQFTRATRFDFYSPEFAHLGEQPILNREIYMTGVPGADDQVWGYIPRWDEYRSRSSVIAGKFLSSATGSLDSWHLAIDFDGSSPSLNNVFIEDNPPIARVIAVQNEPQFIFNLYHTIRAARPMPVYAMPGLARF